MAKINHMMYLSGLPHHKVASDKIIEEVVTLVEKKSKELRSKSKKFMIPVEKVKSIVQYVRNFRKRT